MFKKQKKFDFKFRTSDSEVFKKFNEDFSLACLFSMINTVFINFELELSVIRTSIQNFNFKLRFRTLIQNFNFKRTKKNEFANLRIIDFHMHSINFEVKFFFNLEFKSSKLKN